MNEYILIVSLGPVQGFIAAARRSRDLWSGSWLLSEISKAAALALRNQGAALIFPAPGTDLTPGSDASVGNKVQALVRAADESAVRALAAAASAAAKARFVALADEARRRLPKGSSVREAVWNAQLDDYVETFAGWARIGATGYGPAVRDAAAALAARKATRDFAPSARWADEVPFFGLPKSSLDGARETVLLEGALGGRLRLRLGLSGSEQLDCAGLIKRLGGRIEQFTPITRIAAHAWIEQLDEGARQRIGEGYEALVREEVATRVQGNDRYAALPYDAQYLYPSRLEAALGDARDDPALVTLLDGLRRVLEPLWRRHGEPCPYFVILLADGDRMGALLNEVDTLEHHVRITEALTRFAGEVPDLVKEFDGHAVYAGGDDVFAFLPLHTAHACARRLQAVFSQRIQPVAAALGASTRPTLSVGLGIGHMLEPLGELRSLASRAEKHAKGDRLPEAARRNALAITLRTRGNTETQVRLRWDDEAAQDDFSAWLEAYAPAGAGAPRRTLPSRMAYDARAVHQRTAFALAGNTPQRGIVDAEFARLLMRARTETGEVLSEPVRARLLASAERIGLAQLADQLIVARWLAARDARDIGERR